MLRLTELEIIPLLDSPLWLFLPFFKTIHLRISPQPLLCDILLIDRCSPCFRFFSSLSSHFFGDDFSKTQGLIFLFCFVFTPFISQYICLFKIKKKHYTQSRLGSGEWRWTGQRKKIFKIPFVTDSCTSFPSLQIEQIAVLAPKVVVKRKEVINVKCLEYWVRNAQYYYQWL